MSAAGPISLAPSTMLNGGRYRVERELNRGGTAVVYAAEDMVGGGYVALKVMNGPDLVPIKVVKREVAFSASARHDNIVRLMDVFAEKAQLVIVWELISGPDLLDLLNEHGGRLPEPMAAFFFVQLLQAVLFMHANGFCHRDIKPENCMVQRSRHQLKLIDFGLSKHLESARTLGVGTPDYLSPEMLQVWTGGGVNAAAHPYDARAVDAWAMGVMMYLLVTGKYPFEDPRAPNNLAATIHNVLAARMRPFPDHMSQGCQALISGLLRVEPSARTKLQDLLSNEWLLSEARAHAAAVGRVDLVHAFGFPHALLPAGSNSASAHMGVAVAGGAVAGSPGQALGVGSPLPLGQVGPSRVGVAGGGGSGGSAFKHAAAGSQLYSGGSGSAGGDMNGAGSQHAMAPLGLDDRAGSSGTALSGAHSLYPASSLGGYGAGSSPPSHSGSASAVAGTTSGGAGAAPPSPSQKPFKATFNKMCSYLKRHL